MLRELHVRNLAVAEAIDLNLEDGFTVVTGETGAGKSILIDALALALGAKPDADDVRSGADALTVEARFSIGGDGQPRIEALLRELDLPCDGELLITRTVPTKGRSSARINDRGVTQATLIAVGSLLADIHGQNDNISLLRPADQLALLDRFAALDDQRAAFAADAVALRALREQIRDLSGDDRERARRVAQLRYEADEIAAAALQPGEDEKLGLELDRLAHAQDLAQHAEAARAVLEDEGAAIDALGVALARTRSIVEIDPAAATTLESLEGAHDQASDALRLVRQYIDGVELNPARLDEVEARLSLIHDLQRRYGDTALEIIAHGESAADEAAQLDASDDRLVELRGDEQARSQSLSTAANALSEARRTAAARFVKSVTKEAKRLQLPHTRIGVRFDARPASADALDGLALESVAIVIGEGVPRDAGPASSVAFDNSGIDQIEWIVSFNPNLPPRSLARVASGGETARLMLAIKTVLGQSDPVPTLVLDELDIGLGGRSGAIVGQALRRLARSHQVLCITHLPQVAAYSTAHLRVQKSVSARESRVTVEPVRDEARIRELAEMLGSDSETNRRSARELLEASGDTRHDQP